MEIGLTFESCVNDQTELIEDLEFYSFELLIDNKGLDANDLDFILDYQNLNDINIGADAPSDRFIATSLGQNTLVFPDESDKIETAYDAELHSGTWSF